MSTEANPTRKARVAKPDQAIHKANIERIEAEINTIRKKQEELMAKINSGKNKNGNNDPKSALLERLKVIKAEQAELKSSRKKVFDQQDQCKADISKLTTEIKTFQAKQKFHKISDIDNQISSYDAQIERGMLKLVDEKRLLNEISALRRSRKVVEAIEAKQNEINAKRAELDQINSQLSGTNAKALSDEYNEIQKKLDELKEQQSGARSILDDLYTQRNELKEKIDSLYEQKRTAITENREKSNEYYLWQQEDRKIRAEQDKIRREAEARDRLLERAKEEREMADIPAFQEEINNCNNLISYLQVNILHVSAEPTKTDGEKKENGINTTSNKIRMPDTNTNVPEGKVLLKKQDREEDYFAGSGSTKNKKKSNKSSAHKASQQKQGLRLPLAVLERFNELKIDPPMNAAQVAETVKVITERRESYLKDQESATNKNRIKAEEKIAKLMAEASIAE
ncbi:hypothetical protein BB558_002504 [Smittium angustum]|uniref:Nuclear segregation protein Bfr1 n=1 Tax=Smittium angustum TaxID=133377 RepID=A0A2U1IZ71_SMIAN|nr:hypothetical protein BB558_005932 [Smittium angustum]PWA01401.1 hypothetical protein BB558_002504 [Smittium angustum]